MRRKPFWTGALAVAALATAFVPGSPSPVVMAATRQFRGVNWADARDNFVPDALVLGGLDPTDSYAVTRQGARNPSGVCP